MSWTHALLALATTTVAGCSLVTDSFVNNDFSGDPFPVLVDTSTGAILVGVRKEGIDDRTATLDILSPLTVLDPGKQDDDSVAPATINSATLTVLGARGNGELDLPRAVLVSKQVLTVHPCPGDRDCTVGPPGAALPIAAIIGADALAGDAVRLRLGEDQVFILPDIGGSGLHHTYECDAELPQPFRGGGTLLLDDVGTAVPFGGRRAVVQACLAPDPDPEKDLAQSARGTDVLTLLSTGIGVSLITEAAYERYRLVHPAAPVIATLPATSVNVTSGTLVGHSVTIDALDLVGDSDSNSRAPCRQVYAHHLLSQRNCTTSERDCPCTQGDRFCAVPAVIELTPAAGLPFLIVDESDRATRQFIQGLRTELRPDEPELDVVLGTSAMQALELDVDYPHNRLLARCAAGECSTRPALSAEHSRARVNLCISLSGADATSGGMTP